MPIRSSRFILGFAASAALALTSHSLQAQRVGIFDGHQDVGKVLHAGSVEFDAAHNTYTVAASGWDMWAAIDDFHFAWKKVAGDAAVTADISFVGEGHFHRKALLMIRQNLNLDSKAAYIAQHADGMTALQFREANGGDLREIVSNVPSPKTVKIEKRGEYVYMFVAGTDGKLRPSGAAIKLSLTGDYYIGIGFCSHDENVVKKAVFRDVKLEPLAPAGDKTGLVSTLETVEIETTFRNVEYTAAAHFEAPNWTRDGKAFIFNQEGTIRRLEIGDKEPAVIPTAPLSKCNNDHGISPDGQWLAVSSQSGDEPGSRIYLVPIGGGTPKLVTKTGGSYWHGWSPDGKTLAFAARRTDQAPIFSIALDGSNETQLTSGPGANDGPDYSPDGAWIYFNTTRTGQMQIWRMKPDGSAAEQVISSDSNDWFPHISPNGQWMVYLSYDKSVTGHPPNKDVELRLMSLKDKKTTVLAKLFGGQGTMNVPSWSPDSKKVAFVSYELVPEEELAVK
jgi:hypothetical protein